MNPITRLIDEACGYTPEAAAKAKAEAQARREEETRQAAIMTNLLGKVEAWYAVNSTRTRRELREAWRAVRFEDKRVGRKDGAS